MTYTYVSHLQFRKLLLNLQYYLGYFLCTCPTTADHDRLVKVVVSKQRKCYTKQQLKIHWQEKHFSKAYYKNKKAVVEKKPDTRPVDKSNVEKAFAIMFAAVKVSHHAIEDKTVINACESLWNLATSTPDKTFADVFGPKLMTRKQVASQIDDIAIGLNQLLL